jgi:hypothetical protein
MYQFSHYTFFYTCTIVFTSEKLKSFLISTICSPIVIQEKEVIICQTVKSHWHIAKDFVAEKEQLGKQSA